MGAKLWTIQLWTTNVLFWDQWDELTLFFKPWLDGKLVFYHFFVPHNEHRILFTRLLDLMEVKINGQWDIYLQTVINAGIHSSFGCGLVSVIWFFSGRKHSGLICLILLPFFSLPFAMENTITGFQSQMYLLSIFSLVVILGLGFGKPLSLAWWGGLVFAWLSIGTMASGFFASVAVIGLLGLRALCSRKITQHEILTGVCCLWVVAYSLRIHETPRWQKKLMAKTFMDFADSLVANLQWPFHGLPIMTMFVCLPLVILAVCLLKNRIKNRRAAEFVLTLGLWGVIQSIALAYARAGIIQSRYLDTMSTLGMASVAAIFVLADDFKFAGWRVKFTLEAAIIWLVILLAGLLNSTINTVENYGPRIRSEFLVESEDIRAFIATDNPEWIRSKGLLEIPHLLKSVLVLRQHKVVSILPEETRKPLRLEADGAVSSGFSTNAFPAGNQGRPFAKVWGDNVTNCVSASHFLSLPIFANLPKLSVQLYRGTAPVGVVIQLVEKSGRRIELHPMLTNRWQTMIVDTPSSPFRLEISNNNSDAPVAVGDIKDLGRYSVWAQNLVQHYARLILWFGLSLCLAPTIFSLAELKPGLLGSRSAWLVALFLIFAAMITVVKLNNTTGAGYAVSMHKKLAAAYYRAGHPARAELHLREALWLQPDNLEVQRELVILKANGISEILPEKIDGFRFDTPASQSKH